MTDSCVGATGTNDITDSRYLCLFHPAPLSFGLHLSLSIYCSVRFLSSFLRRCLAWSFLFVLRVYVRFFGVLVGRILLASLQRVCTKATVHQQYPKMSKAPSSHVLNAFSTTLKLKSPNKRKWLKTIHCTKYPSHQF